MPLAGEIIVAGQIPGERIATSIATANSAAITTTETVVMTVVAPVVVGRIYKVTINAAYSMSVSSDSFLVAIREDSVAGAQFQARRLTTGSTASAIPFMFDGEYTADATEDKTIVATFDRSTGTGNIILSAAASFPSFLYVDYIRG